MSNDRPKILFAVAAAAFAVSVPFAAAPPGPSGDSHTAAKAVAIVAAGARLPAASPRQVSPAEIAGLFAVARASVKPAASASSPIPTPPPVQASPLPAAWISFIGRITDPSGTILYYFKDARTGRIFKLAPGESSGAARLDSVAETSFAMTYDGSAVIVRR